MDTKGVLLDFYGTLARATRWAGPDEVLSDHGYTLNHDARAIYFSDGVDGVEHDEHSKSRDHYVAWQRERALAMLAAADVHPGEYEAILEKLHQGTANRAMEAYDEVPGVLTALRDRGLRIFICSNWDWDLREAVEESGLTDLVDGMVSSAWVGVRKPHPRIYAETLAEARLEPGACLFAGDTWGADVEGPLAAGLRPIYLRRDGHWPDHTRAAEDPIRSDVPVTKDLQGVLDQL